MYCKVHKYDRKRYLTDIKDMTIGFYKSHKLHLLYTGGDEVILLSWVISPSNEHDSRERYNFVQSMDI